MKKRGSSCMEVKILELLDGAKKSEGFTVIIDVFRAFTLECFAYYYGAKRIYPIGDYKDCFVLKEKDKNAFIIGERGGKMLENFDCGNSPSQLYLRHEIKGKTIYHSTSSGTQGIMAAINNIKDSVNPVTEILTGALVNAKAIARYIKAKNPKIVSLVAMGWPGCPKENEDTLCAEYIKYLLETDDISENEDKFDLQSKIIKLKDTAGSQFFDFKNKEIFPLPDFFMCLMPNVFDFVLKIEKDEEKNMYYTLALSDKV